MRNQVKEPFLPFVTVDDIVRFNIGDAATYTESRFINAVLRAIHRVGAADTRRIASYMALEEHMLNHGVRLACGMTLTALRSVVTVATAARMHAADPKTTLDDIAARLGYGDRSSIWAILNNKKYAAIATRLCPALLLQRHQEKMTDEEWERMP